MGHNFFVGISHTSCGHAVATFKVLRSHSICVGVPQLKKSVCFCNFLSYWTCCFISEDIYHSGWTLSILYTYLLTPWCRVLLEKLTGLQLVKKFPAFYGTRRFITALTNVRHLSLSWASPIQSTYPHPTSWRSIIILSTHLRLGLIVSYIHGKKSIA